MPPTDGDSASIDSLLAALHKSISGRRDQPRDEARFRSLFTPDARFCRVMDDPARPGKVVLESFDADSFLPILRDFASQADFFEVESGRSVVLFSHIAHSFSGYESRRDPAAPPFQVGVNSFQFFFDGDRWWISSALWDFRRGDEDLPHFADSTIGPG